MWVGLVVEDIVNMRLGVMGGWFDWYEEIFMIYVFDWFCFDGCCVLIIGFGCGIGLMFVCGFVEVGVVIVINDCNEEKVVMFVCWFCDEGFVVDYVVFDVVEYV